jgi:hypothetical protein
MSTDCEYGRYIELAAISFIYNLPIFMISFAARKIGKEMYTFHVFPLSNTADTDSKFVSFVWSLALFRLWHKH